MTALDAWWLPGYQPAPATRWYSLAGPDGLTVRAPCLDRSDLEQLAGRLRRAQADYLGRLGVDQIAERIGWAVNRWLDPFSPYLHRAERHIAAWTGYPPGAIRKGLAGFLATFRTENLRRLLREELGDPEVLDGFRPRPVAAGLTRAIGPGLVAHSFAGNVPGLPAQSLVAALLVKAASLGKVASEEPLFAPLFARSLAEVDPRLGECLALSYWPGGDAPSATSFELADVVVAYGSEATLDAVRAELPPGRRLIAYGHKLSFGVVGRECLSTTDALPDLADRAAYDVARFDQQGCLSPHLFYVEEGGARPPRAFAEALADALRRWDGVVPRGRLDPAERARTAGARREQQFRISARGGERFGADGDAWAVLYDPDDTFLASCLNRTVWVKPLADAGRLPAVLAPVRRYLQTGGIAFDPDRTVGVAELLAEAGLDRVCPIGQMGDAPATWHHDGRFNLLDFVRFTDLEPAASAGRWEFAHPDEGVLGIGRGRVAVDGR
jgi:Acyl-CoA reductase (LuxC)